MSNRCSNERQLSRMTEILDREKVEILDKLPKLSINLGASFEKKLKGIVLKWQKKLKLNQYKIMVTVEEAESTENLADHFIFDSKAFVSANENPDYYIETIRSENVKLIWILLYPMNWKKFSLGQCERSILHELLHIVYPEKICMKNGKVIEENELWIWNKSRELLEGNNQN